MLAPRPGSLHVDGTVGGGGHTERILEAASPDGRVLGLDADPAAIARVGERLARYGDRLVLRQANFRDLRDRRPGSRVRGRGRNPPRPGPELVPAGGPGSRLQLSRRRRARHALRPGGRASPPRPSWPISTRASSATCSAATARSPMRAGSRGRWSTPAARHRWRRRMPWPRSWSGSSRDGRVAPGGSIPRRGYSRRSGSRSTASSRRSKPPSMPPSTSSGPAAAWSSSPTTRSRTAS